MMRSSTLLLTCLLATTAFADHHASVEMQVREAATAFSRAYAENRVDDYFSYYADEAKVFFYGARQDLTAYYEEWSAAIEAGGGVEKNDVSDLQVQVLPGGEAAVTSYFVDYRYRSPEGEVTEAKGFETETWQKIDGEWQIVNLHYSEH